MGKGQGRSATLPLVPRPLSLDPSMSASPFVALRHRNFRLLWIGQIVSYRR